MLGIHVGRGFSHRGHVCFPFWHAVGVHGPCNKKMSPLSFANGNAVDAFIVKPLSFTEKVLQANYKKILLVALHSLNLLFWAPHMHCCDLARTFSTLHVKMGAVSPWQWIPMMVSALLRLCLMLARWGEQAIPWSAHPFYKGTKSNNWTEEWQVWF